MEFLDSLDLDPPKFRKSRRVRSWYLYEQFKSLERNQLDAASRLRSRSYQDRLLRQELTERRARRNLSEQFGETQSEFRIEDEPTRAYIDFEDFNSYYELQDDEAVNKTVVYEDLEDYVCRDFLSSKYEGSKAGDDAKDYNTCMDSVVQVKSGENLSDQLKHDVKEQIPIYGCQDGGMMNFDDINRTLRCLEKLVQMQELDDREESLYSIEEEDMKRIMMHDKDENTENNIYYMWTKLVSFAHQLMELNHGNCYYDYGYQLSTAVIAFDILRRGINSLCYVLQPYICPLKYDSNSETDLTNKNEKNEKLKKICSGRKCGQKVNKRNSSKMKSQEMVRMKASHIEDDSNYSKYRINRIQYRPSSESKEIRRHTKNSTSKFLDQSCSCLHCKDTSCRSKISSTPSRQVKNPMLRISRCLDYVIRDIDQPI